MQIIVTFFQYFCPTFKLEAPCCIYCSSTSSLFSNSFFSNFKLLHLLTAFRTLYCFCCFVFFLTHCTFQNRQTRGNKPPQRCRFCRYRRQTSKQYIFFIFRIRRDIGQSAQRRARQLFPCSSAAVFTPWVCASKALCASAASTMFYKANRKVFFA